MVNPRFEARQTSDRGRGLFALVDFAPGDLICGMNEGDRRLERDEAMKIYEIDSTIKHHWALDHEGRYVIPDVEATGWHCANNSCNPNARLAINEGVGLRARRHIRAGSEVTCWYGWTFGRVRCLCGEEHCSGWIGVPCRPEGRKSTMGMHDKADFIRLIHVAVANDNYDAIKTLETLLVTRLNWPNEHFLSLLSKALAPDNVQADAIMERLWRNRNGVYDDHVEDRGGLRQATG